MARTPWRDALDAKARIMRTLTSGTFNTITLYEDHETYRDTMPDSEPIWVSDKIARAVLNQIQGEDTLLNIDTDMVPDPALVWFERPLMMQHAPLNSDPEIRSSLLEGIHYVGMHNPHDGSKYLKVCLWLRSMGGQAFPSGLKTIGIGENIQEWMTRVAQAMERGKANQSIVDRLRSGAGIDPLDLDSMATVQYMYGMPLRYLATLLNFMEQRILVSPPTAVDREARRAAERVKIHPEVRVMTWRLKKYEKLAEGHRQVDWSCRWPSRAHVRHLADGRTINIPGCIKGPPDKPLKAATPNVHRVTRG